MASLPTTRTILAVQILTLFAGSFCAGGGVVEAVHRGQREFDYFKLSLQCPGTLCRQTRHCCSSNACCRGANTPSEFTIHGLWPDYNDGTWPACCTRASFDVKEIATLREALEKYWPSVSCGMTSTCHGGKGLFWAHGWEKHGTCSSPVVRDEYNYFLTTLNVYFKYNVTEVLKEAGYVPSDSEKILLEALFLPFKMHSIRPRYLFAQRVLYKNFGYASKRISRARKWWDSMLMVTSQGILLTYRYGARILAASLEQMLPGYKVENFWAVYITVYVSYIQTQRSKKRTNVYI